MGYVYAIIRQKENVMVNFKSIQQQIIYLIRKQGNKGEIIRTVATGNNARNSYDENGEEIAVSDTGTVQKQDVFYIHKRLEGKELHNGSYNDEYTRFSIISQSQIGEDVNRLTVLKGDVLVDSLGVRYSIEKIEHVGQLRNREMLLEVVCKRA